MKPLALLVAFLLLQVHHALGESAPILSVSDSSALYWDASRFTQGQTALQLYPASTASTQRFTWTASPKGSTTHFTVCSGAICLADTGTGSLLMGTRADLFTITGTGAVQDVTSGRYVSQPAKPTAGSFLTMGSVQTPWKFNLASSATSASAPISVMPMGDSITEGFPTTQTLTQGGYRCPLQSILAKDGISILTSGNGINGGTTPAPISCSQSGWEGHYGYTIAQIENMEESDASVSKAKPQIILLLAGTNDVAQGLTASVGSHLSSLLDNLLSADPQVHIFLATIPPMNPAENSGVSAWAKNVPAANAQIKAVAAEFGSKVTLVDLYSTLTPADIDDGVHPNLNGYAIIAADWANAIEGWLK